MKVIIAAAGTGGHINPGIAIANKIKEENKSAEIIFVGTKRGLENDLVPRAGYELKTIDAYGINRKINFTNFKNMLKTLKSYKTAKKIIKEISPNVVIGTGGYICGPIMMAANKYKIPTILHESNAFPGASVRLLSKIVNSIMVGFEDTKNRLKKAKRVVVTGTPTRFKKIVLNDLQKEEIRKSLDIQNNLPIILVFGGSQGAKSINDAMIGIIEKKLNKNYQVIWAVGTAQYDEIKQKLQNIEVDIEKVPNMKIVPYIYNMAEVMSLVDIIVARSGAMTITEVAIAGKPAIFIPFPYATENHQEYNAKVLEGVGAANIIKDKDLDTNTLNNMINNLISKKEKLKEMGKLAESTAITDVQDKIYKEIMKQCK